MASLPGALDRPDDQPQGPEEKGGQSEVASHTSSATAGGGSGSQSQSRRTSVASGGTGQRSHHGERQHRRQPPAATPKPKGFKEEIRRLWHADTNDMMSLVESNRRKAVQELATWCLCCLWLPMLVVVAAFNTKPTCERDLFGTLIAWGVIVYLMVPLGIAGTLIAQKASERWPGLDSVFNCIQAAQSMNVFLALGLCIWGIVEFRYTTDTACFDVEASVPINPRLLLGVLSLLGVCCISCVMVPFCCVLWRTLARILPEEEDAIYTKQDV